MPSAIRQYFSSYDRPTPNNNDVLIGPPIPIGGGGTGVGDQPGPITQDYGQQAAFRANRIRDYLALNPSRRPGPMGRNPDGSINWDTSTGIGAQGAADDAARRAAQAAAAQHIANRPAIRPGAFNAAAGTGGVGGNIPIPRLGTGGGGGY